MLVGTLTQAQVEKFKYQPSKVDVGSVYHYVKSNKDGSLPEQIVIYVAAADRLEVFKYHPETKASQSALVIAYLDYKLFHADKLESWRVTSLTDRALVASLEFDEKTKMVEVKIGDGATEKTEMKYIPFHIYNFDLSSLNFMMRHLADPESSFQVGIADPNFAQEGPLFLYRGEVKVDFAGDEKREGQDCRKYKIDGPGVSNRGGFIWVRKDGEFFQEVDMDLPDNPNWQSFRLVLQSKEKKTPEQWKQFMDSHFSK